MKSLFKGIWWLITLPVRIIWKLRKLFVLAATALGVYKGYKNRQAASDSDGSETESSETSDS